MSGLLEGKTILITGIITDASLAFHTAKFAQEQGARVLLTGFGRLSLVNRIAKRLPQEVPPVIELDVQNHEHLTTLADRIREYTDHLDGVVHSIAYAPPSCLGNPVLEAPAEDVKTAIDISTYSYAALAKATLELMTPGSALIGMDFDARMAMPFYNWMGVAKAALESVNRYVARELGPHGIRANLVAAGPMRTLAAKAIMGSALGGGEELEKLEIAWNERSPLNWNVDDPTPVAKTVCAVLSDFMPMTTGSIIYADGGAHAYAF